MNRRDLKALLDNEGVAEDSYTFDGGHPAETYVLSVVPGGWTVYYSERGPETASGRMRLRHRRRGLQAPAQPPATRPQSVHFHLVIGPLPAEDADAEFQAWRARNSVTASPVDERGRQCDLYY